MTKNICASFLGINIGLYFCIDMIWFVGMNIPSDATWEVWKFYQNIYEPLTYAG